MSPKMSMQVSVLVTFHLLSWVTAEFFTAITEMEPLLETHKKVIDDLDHYISKQEKKLSTLKKQLDFYKTEHDKAMEDIPNYLGNPINAFTLIKRLTSDKDYIEQSIQLGTEYVQNKTMCHDGVKYPSYEDLAGAAVALARVQDTYQLKVNELSAGILNGVVYSSPMSAGDCFELGLCLYNQKEYGYCIAWMKEALNKYNHEIDVTYSFDKVDILEYITYAYYFRGDINSTLESTKKLLEIEPGYTLARDNVPRYEKKLLENEKMFKRRQFQDTRTDDLDKKPEAEVKSRSAKSIYNSLCRGEMDIPMEISMRLKCWYLTDNHPFLRLAPLKVEQMYIQPDIFVFHQVISDDEIEYIKGSAKPKFSRAMVLDTQTGNFTAASFRISKSAWLSDQESPVIAGLSQRVADMTGLTMDSAEDLQVLNYGIGGHYVPHVDFFRPHTSPLLRHGRLYIKMKEYQYNMSQLIIPDEQEPGLKRNMKTEKAYNAISDRRIATVLFYMSDVPQGGATVFTELGLTVFPQKSSAVFWMNLHPSGEGDMATKHAACPVLRGSKWVSNKLLHQSGQEFLRPCNLEYQSEGILRQLPQPIPKRTAIVK